MGLEITPGMADGLEKVGMRGVCGALPACPLVMSYPALIENPVVGGPTGGAVKPGTGAGEAAEAVVGN